MRFGKIEFLNLLPFDMFIKSYPLQSRFKQSLFAHSSYPAKLNQHFLFNRIDAGFISSIAGIDSHRKKNGKRASLSGIIAKGEVWSVLVRHATPKSDYQSDTSNALSKILNIKGEVIIGDKALLWLYQNLSQNPQKKCALEKIDFATKSTPKSKLDSSLKTNPKSTAKSTKSQKPKSTQKYTDMGQAWFKKNNLPFVFGRLCYAKKYARFYDKISHAFNAKRVKIPHFWLIKRARQIGIPPEFAKEYLKHIYYKISPKEYAGILRFYRALRLLQIKPPKREYKRAKSR